ncbi:MAG: NADH-quinone oxidoreductase subunit C [Candidatus Micrarchaeia archaeon]
MPKIEYANLDAEIEKLHSEGFTYLTKITAVDYVDHVEVLYFLRDIEKNKEIVVRSDLAPNYLRLKSIMHLYPAADWYERELSEMFGIDFIGRKTKRLLLEKWDGKGNPLRKSFTWGSKYEVQE